jgi:hypothetical protein
MKTSELTGADMLNIDWALLRRQKLVLMQVIDKATPDVALELCGILHLIDTIQDIAAANSEIGIKEVFGELE